jgi:hypothetical protein
MQHRAQEVCVQDVNSTIERYFAVWNETDQARRRELIAEAWSADASYLDPLFSAEGRDGVDGMVGAFQAQMPEHRFRLASAVDSHHDRVRFTWHLWSPDSDTPVFTGVDFGVLTDDGRLQSITGFLEQPNDAPA